MEKKTLCPEKDKPRRNSEKSCTDNGGVEPRGSGLANRAIIP
jgi:hypothetical protein